MIRLTEITTFNRMRQAESKHVAALAESIKEVGLLNPITVAPSEDGYALVAGMHRLEACRSLGWEEIPATIINLDEQRLIIAECDENLCAPTLTASEKAFFTARRKAAYEALHPETAHGTPTVSRQLGDTGSRVEAPRFTADTAARTGQSERVIQRDAERGEKVGAEALSLVRGTKLDKGAYLDSIKNLPVEDQVAKVSADLSAPEAPKAQAADASDASFASEEAKERRALAKLTTDALIDEVIGLRADLADAKAKVQAQKAEIEQMKADLAAFKQDDIGRALGNAQRQARAAEGQMKEYQAIAVRADRKAKALDAENKKLRAEIENQVVTL